MLQTATYSAFRSIAPMLIEPGSAIAAKSALGEGSGSLGAGAAEAAGGPFVNNSLRCCSRTSYRR